MDIDPRDLVRKMWKHSGIKGNVWMPSISNIGKPGERFREGPIIHSSAPKLPEKDDSVDWYFTPAVSHGETRRIKKGSTGTNYPAQKVVWVDCDDSYDRKLLEALRPSYMWETSPGHTQAVWLLKDEMPVSEFHRDGFMGMLTQAIGADKSGVDVSQLLRVPGTWHHKGKAFEGKVLRSQGTVYTRSILLQRVARQLGFGAGLASDIGAEDPYGDRSKIIWKISRNAAELGLPEDLTFKIIRATAWNKWKDDDNALRGDVASAYAHQAPTPEPRTETPDTEEDEDAPVEAWGMATVDQFGPVMRKPVSWLIPDIITEGGCGLLVAAPKVGKTRISIEMALGLATGWKPLGVSVKKPQAVGFFSLEDGEHLFAERLSSGIDNSRDRQAYHWDGHISWDRNGLVWEPPKPMQLFTHFSSIDLQQEDDMKRLYETIEKFNLKIVIIDTLSMAIGRANVSDIKEMNIILKGLREIAHETGCAIMFIHHTRKRVFEKGETIQEAILGSTALHAWCDFILNLVPPEEDSDLLRLGVQTKRGQYSHYINTDLKIIRRPVLEED